MGAAPAAGSEWIHPVQQGFQPFQFLLIVELVHLLEHSGQNVIPICFGNVLSPLQLKVLTNHMPVEFVLPLNRLLAIVDDLLGRQAAILCEGHKGYVPMRSSHGGNRCIYLRVPATKARRICNWARSKSEHIADSEQNVYNFTKEIPTGGLPYGRAKDAWRARWLLLTSWRPPRRFVPLQRQRPAKV